MPRKFSNVFEKKVLRENWNGKYRIVARDFQGRIITWAKYSSKIPIEFYKRRFKESNQVSFKKNIKGVGLRNFIEITDYSEKPKKPRKEKYQYVVEGILKDGSRITARSSQYNTSVRIKIARDEAWESFYERLAQAMGYDYDADEGKALAGELGKDISIKEGVVYYKER